MPSLREEIKQTRPFRSLAEEAYLNVVRTAEVLHHRVAAVFQGHGITPTQYNVLRILRGAGPAGLPCGAIGERMINRDPDVTRLLDRLVAQGLAERTRNEDDRRVVVVTVTEAGRRLLAELDPAVRAVHQRQLGHLDQAALRALIRGLERARERVTGND